MKFAPLTPTIGAEVTGIDLSQSLCQEDLSGLNSALSVWKVLFFRNQRLSTDDLRQLGQSFGTLSIHPFTPTWHRNADVVTIIEDEHRHAENNVWHSDLSFIPTAPRFGLLRAVEMPEVGGDTLFANMCSVYAGLREATKERIEGAIAVHDFHHFRASLRGRGSSPSSIELLAKRYPAVEHPIVRVNERTGERFLYVNPMYTTRVVGLSEADSDELLDELFKQASLPEHQCRFRWNIGAVAIWENQCTMHYAVSDYRPQRRVMERVSV